MSYVELDYVLSIPKMEEKLRSLTRTSTARIVELDTARLFIELLMQENGLDPKKLIIRGCALKKHTFNLTIGGEGEKFYALGRLLDQVSSLEPPS
jgi:hypothetical protein